MRKTARRYGPLDAQTRQRYCRCNFCQSSVHAVAAMVVLQNFGCKNQPNFTFLATSQLRVA